MWKGIMWKGIMWKGIMWKGSRVMERGRVKGSKRSKRRGDKIEEGMKGIRRGGERKIRWSEE